MKSTLPATHLLRHFTLFLFTVLFLLTMVRAGYVLWRFPEVLDSGALLPVFFMGLRYDLALIGLLLILPVLGGFVFGMFGFSRALAKFLVILLLMLGMLFVLLSELITPWFMVQQGVRPDTAILAAVENPLEVIASLWSLYMIPAIIGVVLVALITLAYWGRLEVSRLLRFRLARPSALLMLLCCFVLIAVAVYSGIDPAKPALSPATGLVSTNNTINEMALNTGYKTLYSLALPHLN